MRNPSHFAEGLGTGAGLFLLLAAIFLLGARSSRHRLRIRRGVDRVLFGDPAPRADYLDLCRAAGL
jgi:hypothetical protein